MQFSIKYRPQYLSEVLGQHVSVRILVNSILMDRVPGAILFSGIRGVGKTTLARLYGRALNCENFNGELCGQCTSCTETNHASIMELDAASHSGVDNIRELEEVFRQVVLHKYRVVIFDECHMLSKAAQAALLKIIEEPPRNTVFILVTTDPERLEHTVVSRCLQMPLRPLDEGAVRAGVVRILQSEGVQADEEFLDALARVGHGSMRDVQQILESLVLAAGDNPLDLGILKDSVGIISKKEYGDLADVLDHRNLRFFLEEISRWYSEGRDLALLFESGIPYLLRDFMVYLSGAGEDDVKLISGLSWKSLSGNLRLGLADVRHLNREWEISMEFMKNSANPKIVWDMFAVKACTPVEAPAAMPNGSVDGGW